MHDDDKLKLAREALEWIDYHKDNQDMSHLDFRIGAGNQASESLAAINALDPQLVEAVGLLRTVLDDLTMVVDDRLADPYIVPELQALCKRAGYGNVMSSASSLWRQALGELAGGEFVAGPCRTTVRNQVNRISTFLAKQGDA